MTLAIAGAVATVALALPCVAGAATAAKPPTAGSQGKKPAAQNALTAKAGSAQGIVQSVSAKAIVLRALDGSAVRIAVVPGTRFFVGRKRATLHDVKVGFVATATWQAGKPATLRALDPAA